MARADTGNRRVKHGTVSCPCTADAAGMLGRALRAYARAAYPAGGSDCAQVARETLFDTARRCEAHAGGQLHLRRRQLPQIRAAVNWYLGENPSADIQFPADLPKILFGKGEDA